jgi:hypothetical protein
MVRDTEYVKYALTGMGLTVISALVAVAGLVTAVEVSLIAGVLIVIGSLSFWGYTCVLSGLVEAPRRAA